jgi:hypothetical protein
LTVGLRTGYTKLTSLRFDDSNALKAISFVGLGDLIAPDSVISFTGIGKSARMKNLRVHEERT